MSSVIPKTWKPWDSKDIDFVVEKAMQGWNKKQIAAHFPDRTEGSIQGVITRHLKTTSTPKKPRIDSEECMFI